MDFEKILQELRKALLELLNDKYTEFAKESKKDVDAFLSESKERLERWTQLLVEEKITLDDFEWLLKGQKEILHMKALYKVGVSKISIGHFKNKLIQTVFTIIKRAVFI